MGILRGLRDYLSARTAITDLMGAGAADRIRPEALEQGAVGPAIVFHRVQTTYTKVLRGSIQQLRASTIQVDVWTDDADMRELLAEQVRKAIRTWTGTYGGVVIESVEAPEFDGDTNEPPDDASEERYWRTVLRYVVHHRNVEDV